eukprot:symbB.v1.2.008015.t1/scaffold498.1/size458234/7
MVLMPLPIPIIDLLTSYDMVSNPKSSYPVNFLLGNWSKKGESTLIGSMIHPMLPDSRFVQTEKFHWPQVEFTEHVIEYELAPDIIEALGNSDILYFHKVLTKEISPKHWRAFPSMVSLVIPWKESCGTRYTCLELFAGGYGGWHQGLNFLVNNQLPKFQMIGVEVSLQAAVQHCLNHKTCLIPEGVTIPWNFALNIDQDILFNMKIQSLTWQQTVAFVKPFLWFLSPPCQPWSTSGHTKGLNADDGRAFVEAICLARIHRPTMILVEEVHGFRTHDHFEAIMAIFKWAGYELYHEVTFDMVRVLPIRRERWLAIFVIKDFCNQLAMPEWAEFVLGTPPKPRDFDVHMKLSREQQSLFEPTYDEASTYMNAKYLPMKSQNATREDVLRYRIPGLDKPQHTIMAQYGNQHSLPETLLHGKGLMGFFVRTFQGFRFWTPAEILMMHLQVAPTTLLKPPKLSWYLLGNCICLPHVILLQSNALRMLFGEDRVESPNDALQRALKSRLKATQSHFHEDRFAWYVAHSKWEAADAQAFLEFFLLSLQWKGDENSVFPVGTWFHPSKGLVSQHVDRTSDAIQIGMEISPTLPFRLTADIMLMATPGEYGVITLMNLMTWMDILQLWDYHFQPETDDETLQLTHLVNQDYDVANKSLLVWTGEKPIRHDAPDTDPNKLIVFYEQDRLLVHQTNAKDWGQIREEGHFQHLEYDSAGIITRSDKLKQIMIVKKNDDTKQTLPFVVNAELLSQLQIETIVPPGTDILLFKVQGNPKAIDMMILLWTYLFDAQWMRSKGRVMNIQLIDASNIRILMRPQLPVTALPTVILKEEIRMKIIRSYLASTSQKMIAPPNLIFKFDGRIIHRGHYADDFSFDSLRNYLQHAFVTSSFGDPPSMIALGKRIGDGVVFEDLHLQRQQLMPTKEGPILIVLHEPIFGGGKTPTSKQDFQQVLHAGIANLLLEYGMTLPMATKAVETLMASVGQQRIHHLLHQQTAAQRYSTFETICHENKIELPKHGPQKTKNASKLARSIQNDRIHASRHLPVEQYTLSDGFFQTANGTPLPVLSQFSSFASGICLMNAEHAEQRISQGKLLNSDELGIFILGNVNVPATLDQKQMQAPAVDPNGRAVLLEGTLVQLGEKQIQTPLTEQEVIPTKDIYVASVTLSKQDWEADMWNQLCEAPVRTVKHLLSLEGHGAIMGKPWARTFKDGNLKVPIELATTIQFFAEFDATKFNGLLQRSGFNRIFISPKNETGAPHDNWKVIWVTGNNQQVESQAASLSGAAGLVKGKKSLGIRIDSSAFEQAWRILKPNVELPDTRNTSMLFKIQPLPHGTDKTSLQKWSLDTKWDIKPIRAIGARTWHLVGAIVAGPKYHPHTFVDKKADTKDPQKNRDAFRSGDPFADPWSSYTGTAVVADAPKNMHTSKAAKPAELPIGPIGSQFQQQETRIQAVEQALHQMQSNHQKFQESTDGKFSALEAQINQQNHDQIQAISSLQDTQKQMHDSLAQALQTQDSRISNAFDDLRQLFLSQHRGTKRPGDETIGDQDM